MSYIKEVLERESALVAELDKEQEVSLLKLVERPDGAKDALKFQYEGLDTLMPKTLEKYLGALSQYLIYVTKYVNILSAKKKVATSFYNRKMNEAFFIYADKLKQIKSMSEKEMTVRQEDPNLVELQDHIDGLDAKLALYSGIPDTIEGLIQSIKKVYDSKVRERLATNE